MPTKKKPANKKGVATPKGTKVKEVEVKETKEVIPTSEEIKDKNHIMGKTESYNVHPMERDLYHVSLEKVKFNSDTGERANNLRGISDKTYRAYGVRHKYNEETGEPVEQYYPITEGYAASGYKLRILPKSFSRVGKVGKQSDLFGQWKWKTASGKFVWRDQWVFVWDDECFEDVLLGFGREG